MFGLLVIVLLVCGVSFVFPAGSFDFDAYFKEKSAAYYDEAVQLRRYLHQIPEPCFKENETSKFVSQYLTKLGLEVQTGIAGTGIKAILHGAKDKPVIAVRADMDALPIVEQTGFEFQSQNKEFMHACGHDAHITNGLIAAKILSGIKSRIPATIVFIFQPCEEGPSDGSESGADKMVKSGVLDNPKVDAVVGLHVMPGYPVGAVALREGPLMGNVTTVSITIKGKSSHGAFPHQGIDAIYAASCAVMQFQSLISRFKDPNERAVLTIGMISGGVRPNVIADQVSMSGTVRSFSFDVGTAIEKGMDNILKGLRVSMGIDYQMSFDRGSRYVKNDAKLVQTILPVFRRILGESNVHIVDPVTIGEDFSVYSHKVPGLFFFLGAGAQGVLHSPVFSVDEKIFNYGPMLLARAAVEFSYFLERK